MGLGALIFGGLMIHPSSMGKSFGIWKNPTWEGIINQICAPHWFRGGSQASDWSSTSCFARDA